MDRVRLRAVEAALIDTGSAVSTSSLGYTGVVYFVYVIYLVDLVHLISLLSWISAAVLAVLIVREVRGVRSVAYSVVNRLLHDGHDLADGASSTDHLVPHRLRQVT